MEIVLTTPHGDADIRVTGQRATTTLAELIVAATGQAAPAVVRVDGRAIETSTTLERSGLRRGSVVDTVTKPAGTEPTTLVTLAQIAGPGAGRRHPLGSGRHRLGPGRRVTAAELGSAPVEEPVVTIDVDTDGRVTLHPVDAHRLALAGSPVDEPTPWRAGDVAVVDHRAFVIDRGEPASATGDHPVETTEPVSDGRIAFHRRPPSPGSTERRPVIDAVHDATTRGPGLWHRRPGHADAFVVPIGVEASVDTSPPRIVSIDLAANTVLSVAGPQRAALARTILLEATTLHGPADLDLVVATTPAGAADWDWAKWLPHVRATGRSTLLSDAREIAAWSDALVEDESTGGHITVVVVDGPELWQRREAPLHGLLTAPPDHVRIVTLSAASADAPPTATILLTADPDRRWHLVSTTEPGSVEPVLAALVETDVAHRTATAMAPLDDQDIPVRLPAPRAEPRPLRSLVAPTGAPTRDGVLDEVCAGAVIVGTAHETARTATVLAMRRCLARSCWLLDLLGSPWTAGLDGLAGRADTDLDSGTVDPDRLLARLRHRLADGSTEIVILLDGDQAAGARVMRSATELDAVTVLATTSSEPAGVTLPVVRVERRDGRRRATIDIARVEHGIDLDDDPDTGGLSVRALVFGRPLTALERHIEREATQHPEAFVEHCRELVVEFAPGAGSPPPVLARPALPTPLPVESLFAHYPGDGVPIGIVDDPEDDHDALWWRPDHGHLVAIGAGLDGLLDTVLTGLVDRYGDDEIEIVDGSSIAPDDDAAVAALLDRLEPTDRADGALLAVVLGDLGAVAGNDRLGAAIAGGRCSIVGLAPTLGEAGALATDPRTMLLASSGDEPRGRCRLVPDGRLVQLAEPDRSMTSTGSTP